MKETLRAGVSRLTVHSGITALGRTFFPKDGALIFYGHRVAEDDEGYLQGLRPAWLDAQLAYLTRHYEIISLSTLLRCYEEQLPVPHRSVVLTFDDGFRDNLTNGLPVLERYRVPVTIFVVTGCITSGELPWSQRLGYIFQNTSAQSVQWNAAAGELSLETASDRRRAYNTVKEQLIPLPQVPRDAAIAQLAKILKVEPPRDRMLSWAELAELQARGIELGAHTHTHALLARVPPDEAYREMVRSRDELRERLGIERPSFCFPAGSHNAGLMASVRSLGFRSAFQPGCRHRINNLATTHAYGLSRLGLPNAPAVCLETELDGPIQPLRRMLRWFTPGRQANHP